MRKNSFKALCTVCKCSFSIENGGKSDMIQDMLTAKHKRCVIASTCIKKAIK